MKKIKRILLFVCIPAVILLLFYAALRTTWGSKYVAHQIVSRYAAHEDSDNTSVEGNLVAGITFKNLELENIEGFPAGTVLKIQKLFARLASWRLDGVEADIENMRLKLPDADPIILSGSFKQQQLDLNIYSNAATLMDILAYLPDVKKMLPVKAEVRNIDLFITGHYLEPFVKGGFVLEECIYKNYTLTNSPCTVDLQLKNLRGDVQLFGDVHLGPGGLQTKKVLIKLEKSAFHFSGPRDQPDLNIKGSAEVEKTKIGMVLRGTPKTPELTLSSEPPRSQQKLMLMLATGKSWQSIDGAFEDGLDAAALAKDFVDYFFFAGKSNRFAQRFGISDFSVTYDENRRGASVKKGLSKKLEVGYGIEQTQADGQTTGTSQTLEGTYQVSDKISVGLERELKKTTSSGMTEEGSGEKNDKVLLKYKTNF